LCHWTYYSKVKQKDLLQTQLETPIGRLTLVASPTGLRRVFFANLTDADKHFLDEVRSDENDEVLVQSVRQLSEYFSGQRRSFDIPLDLVGTDFQIQTWHALALIDYGATASYGEQARSIGRPRAVRAVGGANRCNPVPVVLPCHRVIGADGKLTGFAGGLDTKRWLLAHEGAHVFSSEEISKGQVLCN
jgi:methylated-DNA-[protein]-cysteine S-methyltransferase